MFFGPVISAVTAEIGEVDLGWLDNDYARITDVDYKAVVVDEPGSDGKIVVTERITFDIHAASRSNGFWELWRDLCESWVDGVYVHYKVNSVKQILPDGSEIIWEESPKLYWDDYDYISSFYGPGKWYHSEGPYNEYRQQYECLLFYVDDLYRTEMTFEIEYEMYNAVLRYNDCSDLYISMYSGDTIKYIESFSGEILIPVDDMPHDGNYSFVTYGTNNASFPVEESLSKNPGYHTFSFDLNKIDLKFNNDTEFLEFDLVAFGNDKHAFADHAPSNDYSSDDVLSNIYETQEEYFDTIQAHKNTKIAIFVICIFAAIIIISVGRGKIAKFKKKYPFYKAEQTMDTYRDIPSDLDPNFAAELVFSKDKKRDDKDGGVYSALLLSLARKGYVELKDTTTNDVTIVVDKDDSANMRQEPSLNINLGYNIMITPPSNEPSSDEPTGRVEFVDFNSNNSNNGELKSFYTTEDIPTDKIYGRFEGCDLSSGRYPRYNEQLNSHQVNESIDAFSLFEPHEPLTMCEKQYLDLLKRHAKGGSTTMKALQNRIEADYAYMRNFENDMERSAINIGVGLDYLQNSNWKKPRKELLASAKTSFTWSAIFALLVNLISSFTFVELAFGGYLIVAAALLANGIYMKTQSHKYVLLTEKGETEYQKWRGLYNFLKSDTLINERTVVELPLWEKYLVYATAFGISEKVIQAIKIRCPEYKTGTEGKSIVYSSYCRSGRIRTSGRSFRSSVRTGARGFSYSYGSGSYGGGGGYRGGGGRGGGGGGGGH
jgi:hypothetical protein